MQNVQMNNPCSRFILFHLKFGMKSSLPKITDVKLKKSEWINVNFLATPCLYKRSISYALSA